ncbi:ethylene-responsive transcription factor ERF036-like [Dendrobium catenatum]|uniref:ethylene-responsive transcription factor ERF036-like n=1 Tax=Dendrobium catenatum TaxID=906689 RepID=UPI0009F68C4F|nr:ethylene-responsive transcription factor ERF036-like [Dendrobium catenatum]
MANSNPPSQVQISASNTQPSVPPFHYYGVRLRGRKWTSEAYNQHESKNIWIGTHFTPEMAAIAHDVAALAFNGASALLNFPDIIQSLPVPKSISIVDIRAAVEEATKQFSAMPEVVDASEVPPQDIGKTYITACPRDKSCQRPLPRLPVPVLHAQGCPRAPTLAASTCLHTHALAHSSLIASAMSGRVNPATCWVGSGFGFSTHLSTRVGLGSARFNPGQMRIRSESDP